MSVEMFDKPISLFGDADAQFERLTVLLTEARSTLANSYYQPPHWDYEPTIEQIEAEELYLDGCQNAQLRVKEIAANIYFALTGEVIVHSKPK